MQRLALMAAVVAFLVGCGGGGPTVLLRPTSPLLANVYLQVRSPSGALRPIRRLLSRTVSSTGAPTGFVVAATVHGREDCSFSQEIPANTLPTLREYEGKRVVLRVYGNGNAAPALCRRLNNKHVWEGSRVYTIGTSAMEPTLHCARPGAGCQGKANDRVVVRLAAGAHPRRGVIVVFTAPREAAVKCGENGTLVKRVIGLPGDVVHEDAHGFIRIHGERLTESYVSRASRLADSGQFDQTWRVPNGEYFMLGDNRSASCDSRTWGAVPARSIIGRVVQVIRGGRVLRPAGLP